MVVVLCNCGADHSDGIARALVEARVAACVNILPGVRSYYSWEGRLCVEDEHTLLVKTPREHASALVDRLRVLHPYDTPEILVLDVDETSSDARYVAWARSVTSSREPT